MHLTQTLQDPSGLSKTILVAPDGARAEVYLRGAHLTSWIPAGGIEHIYLTPNSEFTSQSAIRGGVSIIFPQYSLTGPLQTHGFAQNMIWELSGVEHQNGILTAAYTLSDSPETIYEWAYSFQLELVITLGGNQLTLTLSITNTGGDAFRFSTALHAYFVVSDISNARIEGLKKLPYINQMDYGIENTQDDEWLFIDGKIDRIYPNARPVITLHDHQHALQIGRRGYSDTAIWNPGFECNAAILDLRPEDYKNFICIKSAQIFKPCRLSPEESWQGTHTIKVIK